MITDWNFWFSVITAIVAITALYESHIQMKISNKQYLFEKRVEKYMIAIGLIQLYRSNCSHINYEGAEPILTIEMDFTWMTNNVYLEQVSVVINNPLEELGKKEFLSKLEEINNVVTELKFLFAGEASVLLGDFVLCYNKFLFAMFDIRLLLKIWKKYLNNLN